MCTFSRSRRKTIFHRYVLVLGNPGYGACSDILYRFTLTLQDYLVLPCIVSTVWLQYSYPYDLATIYFVLSFLPIVTNLFDNETSRNLLDAVVGVNCLTLFVLSVMYQNYYGIAACISHAFNHFIIKEDNETYFNVTSQDLYNYAMCFFAFFSLRTILD